MTELELQELEQRIADKILQNMEREKRNKNMIRRVLDEYNPEFQKFNWEERGAITGTCWEQKEDYKLRVALGAILRIAFQSKRGEHISEKMEPIVRKTLDQILNAMQEVRHEL